MKQTISHNIEPLAALLADRKTLLVCGSSYDRLEISNELNGFDLVRFSDFSPNPVYEDVCKGVSLFHQEHCRAILAVGGGSAMDTAKCIKLFSAMDPSHSYLQQEYTDTGIFLAAIPTTAGTGSESTRHAVIYFEGVKQSISHPSLVPDHACLIPSVLKDLPTYQKKCTMLDALCQAIESWWSRSATEESIKYSRLAIDLIAENYQDYLLHNTLASAKAMLLASNYAGRAINITATTAPHAMSYKLTSLYGIPHGHAVGICMPEVWQYMQHAAYSLPGSEGLQEVFSALPVDLDWFKRLLCDLNISRPVSSNRTRDIALLTDSVNPERLKNNPILLDHNTLKQMYERIVQ